MNLSGKTAFVTGGTDGIGAQLIRQLRELGVIIITHGRNSERVEATRKDGFEVIQADISNLAGVDKVLSALSGREIDILINNAGAGVDHDFRLAAPNLDDSDAAMFLNYNAPVRLIAALLPMLKAKKEAMIVNVTSGLAIAPRAGGPVYCASKAALRSYSMALRHQLKGTNVHVLEALPPVVETKLTHGRGSRKMAPDECARQIVAAMKSNANEANIGMVKLLRVIYAISPALARRIMIKF